MVLQWSHFTNVNLSCQIFDSGAVAAQWSGCAALGQCASDETGRNGTGLEFYCPALMGFMSLEWGDFQAVSYVNISSSLLPFEVLLCINWANFFILELFKQLLVLVRDVPEIVRSSLLLLPLCFLFLFSSLLVFSFFFNLLRNY